MLITVHRGETREMAEEQGHLHFEAMPVHGDRVEIGGALYVVRQSWHVPSDALAAPRAAILVSERLESIFRCNAPATRKPTIWERFSGLDPRR